MTYHESIRVEKPLDNGTGKVIQAVNVDTRLDPVPSIWVTQVIEYHDGHIKYAPVLPITRVTKLNARHSATHPHKLFPEIRARLRAYRKYGLDLTTGEPNAPERGPLFAKTTWSRSLQEHARDYEAGETNEEVRR